MTRARADAAPSDRRRWIVVVLLIALGLGLAGAAFWQRYSPEARARAELLATSDQVLAQFRKDLPQRFGEGLMLEQVHFEGRRLVFTIRSASRLAVDSAQDPQALQEVRNAEQAQLQQSCREPQLLHLLSRGMVVTRRFVDRRGDRFFEVSLTGADCARKP